MARTQRRKKANGEGRPFQRSADGMWVGRVTDDKGKTKTFYAKTKDGVEAKVQQAKQDMSQGVLVTTPTQTVTQYLTRYVKDVKSLDIESTTLYDYELHTRRMHTFIGSVRLNALTPAHVQRLYRQLRDEGLSKRSVEATHRFLRMALNHAVNVDKLIAKNPTDGVVCPHPHPDERAKITPLSPAQITNLFDTALTGRYSRYYELWFFIATTALRLGEATGLRWQDVDFERGVFTVRQTAVKDRNGGMKFKERPKNNSSRRTIPMPPVTVEVLQELRRKQIEERLLLGPAWQDTDLIFCNADGTPYTPSQVEKALGNHLKAIGLPHFGPHNLRHQAATFLLMNGVDIKEIQVLLGHSTIKITGDFYLHVVPGATTKVTETFQNAFKDHRERARKLRVS